ncbi:DUF1707 SHOCT-like domain-containing protein [Cryptosporangium aurantiacum]|uniref:DUF1707 domain-containing protein n=1 Tax=Cryptosporangium aurantiacum TaxID=134849 RepID=A0A1M7QW86_9ACTN|nr:DUF1707 domain-containing protein [Cryptosporangium aurantiacum]SHN36243.1 protein of unknown function [Cryptosporangium aurantiacum]
MSSPLPDVPEPRRPDVRVGDAERQAVVTRLKAALDEGRLDLHEFDERAAAAYAAKTESDLTPLTADLPEQHPQPASSVTARKRLTSGESSWIRLAVLLTGIWLITSIARGEVTFYWPIFPLGIWGLVLLANRLTGRRD